jgi:hypothetical protein
MPAYIVVDTAIENAQGYEKYKLLALHIAESFEDESRLVSPSQ